MYEVYILRGASGRHYIGMTSDFESRFRQHQSGHTHTTKRLGGSLKLISRRAYPTREVAADVERKLKAMKSPVKAIGFLENGE